MRDRRRVDDASAIVDWILAHAIPAAAIVIAVVSFLVPAVRGALRGASLIAFVTTARLLFHPLRFARLSRVWIEGRTVRAASIVGTPEIVEVRSVEHDAHAPWPCALRLVDGRTLPFVARRDSGLGALFDLDPRDRARYERPRDARDSLTELTLAVR